MKWMRMWLIAVLVVAVNGAAAPVGAQEDPREFPETRLIVVISGGELIGVPSDQYVSGQDWVEGDLIELYINGVFIATDEADGNDEGSASPAFLASELGFSIEAGDEVTLVRIADGATESHIVTDLSVGLVRADEDTVAGSAARGSEVHVVVGDALRSELVVIPTRAWTADFSEPGDQVWEPDIFDIEAESVGIAVQVGEGATGTFVFWVPADPPFVPELKADCMRGGWSSLTDDEGEPFKNVGDCVSYVAT